MCDGYISERRVLFSIGDAKKDFSVSSWSFARKTQVFRWQHAYLKLVAYCFFNVHSLRLSFRTFYWITLFCGSYLVWSDFICVFTLNSHVPGNMPMESSCAARLNWSVMATVPAFLWCMCAVSVFCFCFFMCECYVFFIVIWTHWVWCKQINKYCFVAYIRTSWYDAIFLFWYP